MKKILFFVFLVAVLPICTACAEGEAAPAPAPEIDPRIGAIGECPRCGYVGDGWIYEGPIFPPLDSTPDELKELGWKFRRLYSCPNPECGATRTEPSIFGSALVTFLVLDWEEMEGLKQRVINGWAGAEVAEAYEEKVPWWARSGREYVKFRACWIFRNVEGSLPPEVQLGEDEVQCGELIVFSPIPKPLPGP